MSAKRLLLFGIIGLALSAAVLGDGHEDFTAAHTVWSSFWFPFRDGTMASGKASFGDPGGTMYWEDWEGYFAPFEKLSAGYGQDPRGNLYNWESRYHYDPTTLNWYGHCNGFAAAATREDEPGAPGEMGVVYFRVGDKKAALCELHQADGAIMYGQRYDGLSGDDRNDIYPDYFHQTLQNIIRDLGEPLVIEIDAGVEIWNFPCYRYVSDWVDDGNTRRVTTTVYLAEDGVHPDMVGISPMNITYTYELTLSDGVVRSGKWTGGSRTNHPDFLWRVVSVQSSNSYLTSAQALQVANCTLSPSPADEASEPNNTQATAAALDYDVAFGRLFDEDWYKIPVKAGERLQVEIHQEKIAIQVTGSLLDDDGHVIGNEYTGVGPFTLDSGFVGKSGWVWLRLVPQSPQTNRRNYQLVINRVGNAAAMPHIANACNWTSSMFLYNPETTPADVNFHFYASTGEGVQHKTYPTSITALQGHQLVSGPIESFFSAFDVDCQRWLQILSSGPLNGYFLFTSDNDKNLSYIGLQSEPATELYLNHLAVDSLWWTGLSVVNVDANHAANVILRPYTADGASFEADKMTFSLAPGDRIISLLSQLFSAETLARASWVKVEADRPVSGFELFGTQSLEMCEGIPLQKSGTTELYAPWIPPSSGGWWGALTLVNPAYTSVTVKIWPFSADGIYAVSSPYYKQITLLSHRKQALMLETLFPPATSGPIAYLRIQASAPVTGFMLYGSFTQNILCGYPFSPLGEAATAGAFGAYAGGNLIFSNILNESAAQVTLEAYDEAGVLVASSPAPLAVAALSVIRVLPQTAFGGTLPTNWRRIVWRSDKTLFAGLEITQDNRGTFIPSLKHTPSTP